LACSRRLGCGCSRVSMTSSRSGARRHSSLIPIQSRPTGRLPRCEGRTHPSVDARHREKQTSTLGPFGNGPRDQTHSAGVHVRRWSPGEAWRLDERCSRWWPITGEQGQDEHDSTDARIGYCNSPDRSLCRDTAPSASPRLGNDQIGEVSQRIVQMIGREVGNLVLLCARPGVPLTNRKRA
jgi:hypothetical protein